MLSEDQRHRDGAKPVQRRDTAAVLGFVPNREPADAAHRCDPASAGSRRRRCGIRPVRLSGRCSCALTKLLPGASVAADSSLPLLVISASLEAAMRDLVEDTQRFFAVARSVFGPEVGP